MSRSTFSFIIVSEKFFGVHGFYHLLETLFFLLTIFSIFPTFYFPIRSPQCSLFLSICQTWGQFHQRFYVQIFCTDVISAAFSSYILALAKNSYKKCVCLTLMKLTVGGKKEREEREPFIIDSTHSLIAAYDLLVNIFFDETIVLLKYRCCCCC